jgi:hypothetical protein
MRNSKNNIVALERAEPEQARRHVLIEEHGPNHCSGGGEELKGQMGTGMGVEK